MDGERFLGFPDLERPALRRECVLERYAVVILEVFGTLRRTAELQIGWTGAYDASDGPNFLRNQTEIFQFANPQPYVDMIFDHVQAAICEHHSYVDARMLLQEIRDDGKKIKSSESNWGGQN